MDKTGKPKLCMFCGKDESFGPMNREDFVPCGLWDGHRPCHVEKVPAHVACNASFSKDNEYFRDVLAMEAGASGHPEVRRLHKGKLRRKFEKRFGSIRKTLRDLRLRPIMTPTGLYLGHAPSFRVDWPRLQRVLQNVVKGVYYRVRGQPLPQDSTIEILAASPAILRANRDLIGLMGPWQHFGDDVFGCRYVSDTKDGMMACLMQFYRHRVFLGIAMSPEVAALRDAHEPAAGA